MTINLFSEKVGEIDNFLSSFYDTKMDLQSNLNWQKKYTNPVEMADLIGIFVDNLDNYNLNMWVSLDKGVYLHVTGDNGDDIIRYLFERFPY